MKNNAVIRPAKMLDAKSCHALCSIPELKTPKEKVPPLWWLEGIIKENQIFIVAEKEDEIIGFRMGERISCNWAIAHLMAVHPSFRGKGIGTLLVKAFEKECKKRNIEGIMTYIHDNPKTINFFKKNKYYIGSRVIESIKILKKHE